MKKGTLAKVSTYQKYKGEIKMNQEIEWIDPEVKLPNERQECIIEVEYADKKTNNVFIVKQYKVKWWRKFWVGYHNDFPKYNNRVIRLRSIDYEN